eukprot:gene5540-6899_t
MIKDTVATSSSNMQQQQQQQPSSPQLQQSSLPNIPVVNKHTFSIHKLCGPSSCKCCSSEIIAISDFASICTKCENTYHTKCLSATQNQNIHKEQCFGNRPLRKSSSSSFSLFLKKLFSKTSTSLFKKYGQQMVLESNLSEPHLRTWISLFRIENDKYIFSLKYYDIFNCVPLSRGCFNYIVALLNINIGSSEEGCSVNRSEEDSSQGVSKSLEGVSRSSSCSTNNSNDVKLSSSSAINFYLDFLIPVFFYNQTINAITQFCLERPNLNGKYSQIEYDINDRFIQFLSKLFLTEPYHSIIEKRSDWIDLIINYSMKNKVGMVHREIGPDQLLGNKENIYDSPLCTVYKSKLGESEIAIKQFSVDGLGFEWPAFFKEITIIGLMQHPRVIKCHGAYTYKTDKPFIVTEYCQRGNLIQSLNNLKKETVMQQQLKMTLIGTPIYMGEEVIRGQSYTQSADVYSFGIVLWELFTQDLPFKDLTDYQRVNFVLSGGRPTIPDTIPPRVSQLIQDCWNSEPTKRPTFPEILNTLYSISSTLKYDPMESPVFNRLGDKILSSVFGYLDMRSILNVGLVSRSLRRSVYQAIESIPDQLESEIEEITCKQQQQNSSPTTWRKHSPTAGLGQQQLI